MAWGWAWVCAAALGLAVACAWPDPGARLRPRPAHQRPPPDRRRLLLAGASAGAAAVLLAAGLGWWALAGAVAVGGLGQVLLGGLRDAAVARRRGEVLAALPQACDLVAVCLESGLPLRTCAEVVADAVGGALGERLGEVATAVRLGVDEAAAWAEVGAAEPALAGLGREVARTVGSGVALARSLRALGAEARTDAAAAAEQRARRVGVRSVLPLMTCFLPAFLLLGVVPIVGGIALHLLP